LSSADGTEKLLALGDVIIKNNGTINMALGGTVELQGNWNDQVNTGGFIPGTGSVIFSGPAAQQTLTAVSGTELFYNLQINKTASSGLVLLNNSITADHNLTLTKGIFVTQMNLFTWDKNGGTLSMPGTGFGESGSGSYTDSYIATCDAAGNP